MTLVELNSLDWSLLRAELERCCGSSRWVALMMEDFPFADRDQLFFSADNHWLNCSIRDWKEAFTHHPKIGDLESLQKKFASTSKWASGEQSAVNGADKETLLALRSGNIEYEKKFGYIFIVCATGKSAAEMLALLESRLPNDDAAEIDNAQREQMKITRLRLEKLLS